MLHGKLVKSFFFLLAYLKTAKKLWQYYYILYTIEIATSVKIILYFKSSRAMYKWKWELELQCYQRIWQQKNLRRTADKDSTKMLIFKIKWHFRGTKMCLNICISGTCNIVISTKLWQIEHDFCVNIFIIDR